VVLKQRSPGKRSVTGEIGAKWYVAMKFDLTGVLDKKMVVGEGLLGALHLALRVVACGNAFSLSLESNLGRSFSSFPVRNGMRL
jgi:hypothetical protein